MNETALIFTGIAAFGIGYGLAYFAKNITELTNRWGIFVIFLFPIILMFLMMGAAVLSDLRNVAISLLFAGGFVIRMIKRQDS